MAIRLVGDIKKVVNVMQKPSLRNCNAEKKKQDKTYCKKQEQRGERVVGKTNKQKKAKSKKQEKDN